MPVPVPEKMDGMDDMDCMDVCIKCPFYGTLKLKKRSVVMKNAI
jgi:hypothetical protein